LINYLNSQLSIHQIRVIQGFCETDEARFLRIQPFVTNLLEGEFDGFQIRQALLNLVLNAVEACQHSDTVTLRAGTDGNGAIIIDVIDPAGPIPPDVTARIFEPFFTTKPSGTGLGLAIARNIARAHHGDLVLKISQPGQVCFSMNIPARPGGESFGGENSRWARY